MTVHQCPKCELKFSFRTEVDDHCWHDHPEFRHEYPAVAPHEVAVEVEAAPSPPEEVAEQHRRHVRSSDLVNWLTPKNSREHP